jgi:hypothetical protein
MTILLEIWVFMRWCEDLLWDHSEFAHKNQLCSSLNAKTTKARLEVAAFGVVYTCLHEEPTEFDSMDELARFLKTVVFGHTSRSCRSQRGNTLLLCWPHGSHREESSSWTTSA